MLLNQKPSKYIIACNEGESEYFVVKQGDFIKFSDHNGEIHEGQVIKLGTKELIINEDEEFDRIYGYGQLKNVELTE